MKYFYTAALLFISFIATAQETRLKLAGIAQKKWIGVNIIMEKSDDNPTDLTFTRDYKVKEYNRRYSKYSVPQKWEMVTGENVKDDLIQIRIGERVYNVEFSLTANGRDFLTLTRVPENEWDEYVVKTYYAE